MSNDPYYYKLFSDPTVYRVENGNYTPFKDPESFFKDSGTTAFGQAPIQSGKGYVYKRPGDARVYEYNPYTGTSYHIPSWDNFLQSGYTADDIVETTKKPEDVFGRQQANAQNAAEINPQAESTRLRTEQTNSYADLIGAQNALTEWYLTGYQNAYDSSGLGEIKGEIAELDSQITALRSRRDQSVSKTRQNPYMSAANIVGEASEIERLSNAEINNLIEYRNSLGNQYNTGLGEIERELGLLEASKRNEIGTKQTEYGYYTDMLGEQQREAAALAQAEADALAAQTEHNRWMAEFELDLRAIEIAEYNAETSRYSATKPSSGGSGGGSSTPRYNVQTPYGTVAMTASELLRYQEGNNQVISEPIRENQSFLNPSGTITGYNYYLVDKDTGVKTPVTNANYDYSIPGGQSAGATSDSSQGGWAGRLFNGVWNALTGNR